MSADVTKMKETLKVSSVIAGWIDEDYRNGKGGLKSLEVVVKDNLDSDIILFPGGFIMENRNIPHALLFL